MNIFSKVTSETKNPQMFNRIYQGFISMGPQTREADTRTIDQIKETIDAYAKKTPEIKNFIKDIKEMPKKHMGLVADTLELANHSEMTMTNVNLKNINGKNVTPKIIEDMLYASKENPEALDLVESIINHTDTTASKVSLYALSGGVLKDKSVAKQMQETAKIIPEIAEETLSGGYLGTLEKESNFVEYLKTFIQKDNIPDKITSVFKDLCTFSDKQSCQCVIDLPEYLKSKMPIDIIKEKLASLGETLKNTKLTQINLTDILLKDKNIK